MLNTFQPLIQAATDLELTDPPAAQAELTRRLDPKGPDGQAVTQALQALLAAEKIATRGELPVRWGRVSKASPETGDFSIDVVHMNGAGPKHTHGRGEINFCVALTGEPTFDGHGPGWVVLPPGSTHVPTVAGGEMLIVYLLPGGVVEFG
ncbi:MAG: DUF4863 family protein [Planctomycetota bacterium]|nr:DUF4863 family protein [Planctomycetota bacterium]